MKVKERSIKYNFIMNVILTISSLIFPLITFPYITRVLLPDGTGSIAFANSIVIYFSMFAMLGIPTYGIRACAKVRDNKDELSRVVQEIFIINIITTTIVCLFFVFAVFNIPILKQNKELMLISGLYLIFNLFSFEWFYKGLECYTYITKISLIFKLLGTILIFLFVHHKTDYLSYAFISVISNTGYGIFNFYHVKKYIFYKTEKYYDFNRHIIPIMTFFAMSVAVVIYTNLDVVMLGLIKNTQEVGYYDIAIKIKIILVNIVTALGAVVLPRVSYYIEKHKIEDFYSIITKSFELVSVVSIPLMIYFIIMADSSILVLAGDQYRESIKVMKVIMPTLVIIGFSNLLGIQILIPLEKEKIVVRSELIGAIVNVTLNIYFIPRLGAFGAAIGTLAAESAVLIIQYKYLQKMIRPVWKNIEIKKIFVALSVSIPLLICIKLFLNTSLLLELIISSVVFFTSYIVILTVLKESLTVTIIDSLINKFFLNMFTKS